MTSSLSIPRAPAAPLAPRVRFEDADPATPYMYHCHLVWHEDQGMMGQFLVVEPGQQPALTTNEGETDDHHGH